MGGPYDKICERFKDWHNSLSMYAEPNDQQITESEFKDKLKEEFDIKFKTNNNHD